ncbi:TetR/AcrR family transcriptional regulator [Kribbella sp. NBC_01245]|uniref:TetR/AcrR family transcriptional regulator n=1 Tax=Kribbella sp. NBC_01245 TaxID=2903578 RepID=UPI002E2C2051|nr:TetR/AcrR family transcriptional regulator [Kribbella sp. NBC_01245]
MVTTRDLTAKDPTTTQRRLDPARIVASALAIADGEGLPAVTIRRLAQEHEVTPMALYRHFKDKDELLGALADRLLSDIDMPEPSEAPWDWQVREVLAAVVDALRPHPEVANLTLPRILLTEPGLELAERTLGLLVQGGFTPDQAGEIGRQSICSLITLVTTEPGGGVDPEVREQQIRNKRAAIAMLPPQRYPNVVAAADSLTGCEDPQAYYEIGLDLVVAGIRGMVK